MSGIVAICHGSTGFMLTDSVSWDESTGLISTFMSKTYTLPHLASAVACRGHVDTALLAATYIGQSHSFDDIETWIPAAFRENFAGMIGPDAPRGLDIVCMGISEKSSGPVAYFASSRSTPAFEFIRAQMIACPVLSQGEYRDIFRMGWGSNVPATMLKIMERQKCLTAPLPGLPGEYHFVGGSVTLTTITAKEITQRVIHKWPDDKIGHRCTKGN